jgi:hypothetical protein
MHDRACARRKASLYVRAMLPKAAMMIPITTSTNHPILLRDITKRLPEQEFKLDCLFVVVARLRSRYYPFDPFDDPLASLPWCATKGLS